MPASTVTVTPGPRPCTPFTLQVMVYSPEFGYKFQVSIERECSATNESTWKLLFDLYEKKATGADFDQLVHVSYTAPTAATQAGLQGMVQNGINGAQAGALTNDVYPKAKVVALSAAPTAADKATLHDSITKAVTSVDV